MANTDYFVSGIWEITTNASKHISYVLLHQNTDTGFRTGVKTTRAEVVRLIKAGSTIKTIQWNYKTTIWDIGAELGYITENNTEYLRSHRDGTVTDNLDNLIKLNNFF